jgi:hypothetical protein
LILVLLGLKLPRSDEILSELLQGEGEILWSVIHRFINSIWNEDELTVQWKQSVIVSVYKKDIAVKCHSSTQN